MNLTMHVLRTDVRRFALPMLLWIGIAAAERIMQGVGPMASRDGLTEELFELGAGLLWLARVGLGGALIAFIVQAYPLVGSSAFWMTRPLPPGVLFGSRLLLVGVLFVGVPALFDAILMTVYRVQPVDIGLVILESAIVAAVAIVLVMVAAGWTRNFARFVVFCASALAVGVVVVNLLLVLALSTDAYGAVLTVVSEGAASIVTRPPDGTGALLAWLVITATGVVLLRVLYRTRSRARSMAIAAVGAVGACVIAVIWPWPLLQAEAPAPGWAEAESTVSIDVRPGTLSFDHAEMRFGEAHRWRTARVRAFLTGLPHGWVATVGLERARLEFEGGEVASSRIRGTTLPRDPGAPHPMHETLQAALDVDVLESPGLFPLAELPILMARESELPPAGTAGMYRGEFKIDLRRVEVASVLPLRPGAAFQEGSFRLVLEDAFLGEGGPRIRLRGSTARSMFQRLPPPTYSFYLRNRTARNAVAGTLQREYLASPWFMALVGTSSWLESVRGFRANAALIRFPLITSFRLPSASAPPAGGDSRNQAWLRDAELVIIRTVPAGSVDRTLEMNGVMVKAPQ